MKNKIPLILIGYFHEILELAEQDVSVNIYGYTDFSDKGCSKNYLGTDEFFLKSPAYKPGLFFSITPDKPQLRARLFEIYCAAGLAPYTMISSLSYVSSNASIGDGVVIQRFASVSSASMIENGVRINYYANVTHDTHIGEHCVIAPGATILGGVSVGKNSYIGAQAVIHPQISIGENVIIGACANVTGDIPDNVVAYGNPARVMRRNTDD